MRDDIKKEIEDRKGDRGETGGEKREELEGVDVGGEYSCPEQQYPRLK